MRVLVTGAAGFVGSHLAERLVDEGHDVVGIDGFIDYYPRPVKERNLTALRERPNFSFVELDLRTGSLDPHLEGVEVVINEAAMAGLMRSWTDLDLYVSCNVLALNRLLEASRRAGIRRFVQVSTSSVYGGDAVGDETLPTRPISPYGITKLAAEHLVLAHTSTRELPGTILRYFSIYGPRQRPDMAYHAFIHAMLNGRPITVFGDGLQSRSNTYIGDCIDGTLAALEGAAIGEIYNIGGGEEITLLEAIEIIGDAVGVQPQIRFGDARPGDQRRTVADTTKAKLTFGYVPRVRPADGLAHQVRWQRAALTPGTTT